MMKINIIGDGSFGSFLKKELPNYGFGLSKQSESEATILAIPFSAYAQVASQLIEYNPNILLINVCSVQKPSTDILLKYTDKVTSIHPLFGQRTPVDKRNSIFTYSNKITEEEEFLKLWRAFSYIYGMSPEEHDIIMAKTHASAIMAAKQAKVFVDRATDIPDNLIPNSFRLLREFVKTLEDMPSGTIESIMANPYI